MIRLDKTAWPLGRWGLILGVVLAAGLETSFAADKSNSPKPSRKKPDNSAAIAADKPTEALADLARESVVLITHSGRDGKEDGVGSGFVISPDGLIATCLHVIGEARPIHVQLADGKRYEATEVHAWDRKLDLAIVRIQAQKLPALAARRLRRIEAGPGDCGVRTSVGSGA